MREADDPGGVQDPARYELFKALFLRSEGRTQAECHRLIDAHAHELAEKQRRHADELERIDEEFRGALQYDAELEADAVRKAADLIDPKPPSSPPAPPVA